MTRLLLDTQVIVWWDRGSRSLGKKASDAITNADEVYVSAASEWEVAIKAALGKIRYQRSLLEAVMDAGFKGLGVSFEHARTVRKLPLIHRDPFDRILLATSSVEGLTFVTADSELGQYPVEIVDALD